MGLTEIAKKMSQVENYFPGQPSPSDFTTTSQLPTPPVSPYSAPDLVMPDYGAAKKRAGSSSLGSILAMLPLFMIGGNKKRNFGAFAKGMAQSINRERQTQDGVEVWKADQENRRNAAQMKSIRERMQANQRKMDKLFELDPNLYTDKGFMSLYSVGSFDGVSDYLAQKGWKPQQKQQSAKDQVMDSLWQKFQTDPRSLSPQEAKVIGTYITPPTPTKTKAPSYRVIQTDNGYARLNIGTGEILPIDAKAPQKGTQETQDEQRLYSYIKSGGDISKLSDIDQRIAQKNRWIPAGPKTPSRSDLDSIYRMVLGSADALNPFKGFVNMYESPEELKTAIKLQYGENPELYNHAIGLAFSAPQSKFHGLLPQKAATPAPTTTPLQSNENRQNTATNEPTATNPTLIQEVKSRIYSQLSNDELPEVTFARAYQEAVKSGDYQIQEAVKIAIQQLREIR